jgi:hypothetical protein
VSEYVIHVEAKRSWWDGSSTTLCGLKITKVKTSGWFLTVTCAACAKTEKAGKSKK